jgi:hypothetical protein
MEGIPAEKQENIRKIEKLRGYLEQGYFLHGSKNKVEILEPRKANEVNPDRVIGRINGVYASDDLEIPIAMALFATKQKGMDRTNGYSRRDNGPLILKGTNTTLTPGYVYVLPSKTFKIFHQEIDGDSDLEFVSEEPVIPIDTIEVDPTILEDLGDRVKLEFEP